MYLGVTGIDYASFATIFLLDFGTVPAVWYFFCFSFYGVTIVELTSVVDLVSVDMSVCCMF